MTAMPRVNAKNTVKVEVPRFFLDKVMAQLKTSDPNRAVATALCLAGETEDSCDEMTYMVKEICPECDVGCPYMPEVEDE